MSSFSPPALRWVGVCYASCWGFLLCLFLRRLRFFTACPTAGYHSGVTQPFWLHLPVLLLQWSCVCGVCGVFSAAHVPLPQVTLLGLCIFSGYVCLPCCCSGGVGWAAALSLVLSVFLLRQLACQWSLGSAPCGGIFP